MKRAWACVSLGAATVAVGVGAWWLVGRATPAELIASDQGCLATTLPTTHDGSGDMVWVPGGTFDMGAVGTYPEEGPVVPDVPVDGFWISRHEVTNAEFAAFVKATGHITAAERQDMSVVFIPPEDLAYGLNLNPAQWWQLVQGADWRHPEGPRSDIAGRANLPVVHISFDDAAAYAAWAGGELPTEAQFEYAAGNAGRKSSDAAWTANTWQGSFPVKNSGDDGHTGVAPVGCFAPNSFGLYDMVGNVWEWTSTPYVPSHAMSEVPAAGYDPRQPGVAVRVIKGGSYLCAPDYCARYRPEARQAQETGLGAAHIGFRIVVNKPYAALTVAASR